LTTKKPIALEASTPYELLAKTDEDTQVFLTKTVIKGGTPSHEQLALFLWRCKLTGLDPFGGEIVGVLRQNRKESQKAGEIVYDMAIQTTRDGYRVIAEETGRLLEVGEPEYDSEDKSPPRWARVTVQYFTRTGEKAQATSKVRWSEFNQGTSFWKDMPFHMLGVRAEAHALKKAFPKALAGIETSHGDEQRTKEVEGAWKPDGVPERDVKPESVPSEQLPDPFVTPMSEAEARALAGKARC